MIDAMGVDEAVTATDAAPMVEGAGAETTGPDDVGAGGGTEGVATAGASVAARDSGKSTSESDSESMSKNSDSVSARGIMILATL